MEVNQADYIKTNEGTFLDAFQLYLSGFCDVAEVRCCVLDVGKKKERKDNRSR